ncbi:MAG: NAD-dependent epimerase/dehydratase family protein [Candidatus Omnitrophica bacterium]|nr:NAD-dependent epimerase/dehydratase family protein [Candidatus Omnitrophota bacterium]
MDVMRIGVTGASGYIGNALVKELLKENYAVKCLFRKTSIIDESIKDKVELCFGDITNADSLKGFLESCDLLIHAAAIRGEKKLPYSAYQNVNVRGTLNLLELSRHLRKIIFISTVGVTGSGLDIDETTPYNGTSKYHRSKIAAEEICAGFQNVTVVRPAIVYGDADTDGMIAKLCQVIKRKRFLMVGNGLNRLQMVNIRNLVKGIKLIIQKGALKQKYILADECALTFKEITEIIAQNLNVNIPFFMVPKHIVFMLGAIAENSYSLLGIKREPLISYSKVKIVTNNQTFNISKIKAIGYHAEVDPCLALADFARNFL